MDTFWIVRVKRVCKEPTFHIYKRESRALMFLKRRCKEKAIEVQMKEVLWDEFGNVAGAM